MELQELLILGRVLVLSDAYWARIEAERFGAAGAA